MFSKQRLSQRFFKLELTFILNHVYIFFKAQLDALLKDATGFNFTFIYFSIFGILVLPININ